MLEEKKKKGSFVYKHSLELEESWFWVWMRMKGRFENEPREKSRIPLKRVERNVKIALQYNNKRKIKI